mgnify:CR=1 FL=1
MFELESQTKCLIFMFIKTYSSTITHHRIFVYDFCFVNRLYVVIHKTQLSWKKILAYVVGLRVGTNSIDCLCYGRRKLVARASWLYETEKKSSWPVTGLRNRGPLKDLKDSKLIVYESKWFPWSSRINLIPFKIFRGPLFHKLVTGQELFLLLLAANPNWVLLTVKIVK